MAALDYKNWFEKATSRYPNYWWQNFTIAYGVARPQSWWRHQMGTFSALLALCAGNSPVTGEFPSERPVTRSFDVFFDLCLNKRLSKQSWGWWFETPSCPLWHHFNDHSMRKWTSIWPNLKTVTCVLLITLMALIPQVVVGVCGKLHTTWIFWTATPNEIRTFNFNGQCQVRPTGYLNKQ